ncbi:MULTISPECIES: hypothetical protein [unclassified Exiguobacterium]|uniref:hypothetical protein n=1 Tax=unclassified Exiguobacterium TaxID=2644629 RepID=UPI001BEC6415|nr:MULTISPECIES: hypothetical protein [unclassified Exiguobacterium]
MDSSLLLIIVEIVFLFIILLAYVILAFKQASVPVLIFRQSLPLLTTGLLAITILVAKNFTERSTIDWVEFVGIFVIPGIWMIAFVTSVVGLVGLYRAIRSRSILFFIVSLANVLVLPSVLIVIYNLFLK